MYCCQWTLQIVFGKQKQALEIMKEWGAEKFRSSHFKVSTNPRVMIGYIGDSPSYIIDEYTFETIADFEKALSEMGQPQFKKFSDAMAPLIVPSSQKWKIFKIVE